MQANDKRLYEEILGNLESGIPFALATVIRGVEGAPGKTGFKMLIYPDGSSSGTVGGGAIESRVIEESFKCIELKESKYLEIALESLGMLCGGSMAVFIEPMGFIDKLYIFGSGHIGQAVSKIALNLGFKVIVIDDRKELLTDEHFSSEVNFIHGDMMVTAHNLDIDNERMYIVIATRSHGFDQSILEIILRKPVLPKYLGMIASRQKAREIIYNLTNSGIPEDKLSQVKTPIGISIGAITPTEIAISILAEIIQIRRSS